MKKFRLSIALVLMALVLSIVPAVFAQEGMFGASAEDFALWTGSLANSLAADSFAFDVNATVTVAGIEGSNVDVNLAGTGAIDTNAENPQVQFAIAGSVKSGEDTQDVTLELRIVDGFNYFNSGEGWQGSTLEDAQSMFSEGFMSGMGGALPVDPEALASGDLSGLTGMEGFSEAMAAMGDFDPSKYLALTSEAGGDTTDFTLTIDLPGLLGDPAMASMMGAAMGAGGGTDADAAQMQQMAMMLPMMFTGAEIAYHQSVNTADETVSHLDLDVNLPLDQMLGPGAVVAFNFGLDLHDYNAPVSVEVPADVEMMES